MTEAPTLTLADFLLARIAEDEQQIRDGSAGIVALSLATRVLAECEAKRRIVAEARRFVMPRLIRDEYRSDRFLPDEQNRTVRQFKRVADDDPTDPDDWPFALVRVWLNEDYEAKVIEPAKESIFLRLLALPYADHPDYRDEWTVK